MQAVRAAERDPSPRPTSAATQSPRSTTDRRCPSCCRRRLGHVYSDSGLAAGYAYFYIRGIDQTRLNMTFDGVPLHDPEDQAVYFANFGDFASRARSRSSAAWARRASAPRPTAARSTSPAYAADGAGSTRRWAAARWSPAGHAGRLGLSTAPGLYGRVSCQTTDGFREHSGVDQGSCTTARRGGAAHALQALRLRGPRADPARVPRHRRGHARDTCAPTPYARTR